MSPAGLPAPPAGTTLDWLWFLIAGVLAITGLWTFYWALLRDRSRGRRRCPKCWYSMEGVPGTVCPECGKGAKREARLFKTRRRWGWVVIAALASAAGYVSWWIPDCEKEGWTAFLPTPLLIEIAPTHKPPSTVMGMRIPASDSIADTLALRIHERMSQGRAWRWQTQRFFNRYFDDNAINIADIVKAPPAWVCDAAMPMTSDPTIWPTTEVEFERARGEWCRLDTANLEPPFFTPLKVSVRLLLGTHPVFQEVCELKVKFVGLGSDYFEPVSGREIDDQVGYLLSPSLARPLGPWDVWKCKARRDKPGEDLLQDVIIAYRVNVLLDDRVIGISRSHRGGARPVGEFIQGPRDPWIMSRSINWIGGPPADADLDRVSIRVESDVTQALCACPPTDPPPPIKRRMWVGSFNRAQFLGGTKK